MRFDPETGATTGFGDPLEWCNKGWLFEGNAVTVDGRLYVLPYGEPRALCIDPGAGTVAPFGDDIGGLGDAALAPDGRARTRQPWPATVAGGDGKLYSMPHCADTVLCFDPKSGQATVFGKVPPGPDKYSGGVLGPDGHICELPPHRSAFPSIW